jgi:hypothetical protein
MECQKLTGKRRRLSSIEQKGPPIINPNKKPRFDPSKKVDDGSSSSGSDDDNNNIILIINDFLSNPPNNKVQPKKQETINKKDDDKCPNPLCNHRNSKDDPQEPRITVTEIKNIDDLIELGKSYHCKRNTKFHSLDLKILCKLVNPLTELQKMVGLKKVKENMVNQILFFLQGLNVKYEIDGFGQITSNTDMLHTVITGPPGVGKTELGKILGKVYKAMDVLSKGTFKLVSRSDLIAKYLGQTAVKTQDVINSCQGGVMFIDEAYSLGHEEGRDSFSKECLDTLNQNLTEKRDFLCIIAGYKDSLDKCFFNMNDGLRRRFTFRYDIEGYSSDELREIFEVKLTADKWKLEFKENNDEEKTNKYIEFFKKNKDNFPNYGGDIETLFLKCKIAHSKRVVFEPESSRRVLNLDDIQKGFKEFLNSRKSSTKKELGLYD